MRKLEFNGFLKLYIKDLTGSDTLSVHKLTKLCKKNYRLLDSVVLFCVIEDKIELFHKYSNFEYKEMTSNLTKDNFLDEEFSFFDFAKIWDSYLSKANSFDYDEIIKGRIRENILLMMKQKNISNYRIYKDLCLNPGNTNDFLRNGNNKKVSLDVVKKIYNYVSY